MNFAALPPEVNSALMYAGPGSGPIRAAATAWKTMAAELETAANSYRTLITGLTDQTWQGPAAVAMATAAAPYATWMHTTATQAAHAGTQAAAAAAAYETAFAMTVPPAVITANRTQLATLTATNLLGQNTAAIAANEAHYATMWAQDATAMYSYATGAAAATQLPTFTPPETTANPAEATAATAEAASDGGISPGLAFDLIGAVFEVGSVGPFGGIGLGGAFGGLAITLGELAFPEEGALGLGALGALDLIGTATPTASIGASTGATGATWASMGRAVPLNGLSVPQAWAAATPSAAIRQITLVTAQSGTASAAAAAAGAEIPYAEMALSGAAGRALAGTVGPGSRPQQTQPKPIAAPRPPKPAQESQESEDAPARPKAIGVVAELRALVELRDSGVLTQEKFIERKERLLGE
ncbi:PPE domain-containing protein [Mycolicibacter sp. MYC123]|uniref:PPE domain-containing protein n=1 Tax=[Mycobacterium] zoologicum TaxID=2872311 RepID=A0ABU5YEE5_9MYCO|nr:MULTISPECIES: PPE domain-containing protein [unclassified Mycolicibacter]MEB3048417.1 PPE domain-containing protein [Mycolicibacter sp. MYC123]MEB3063866.1 PPE domain-containing protein [Mycolicibacter sp. MYC101]